jgi:hypothetical protein
MSYTISPLFEDAARGNTMRCSGSIDSWLLGWSLPLIGTLVILLTGCLQQASNGVARMTEEIMTALSVQLRTGNHGAELPR